MEAEIQAFPIRIMKVEKNALQFQDKEWKAQRIQTGLGSLKKMVIHSSCYVHFSYNIVKPIILMIRRNVKASKKLTTQPNFMCIGSMSIFIDYIMVTEKQFHWSTGGIQFFRGA